jgi:hypothetical protein
MAEVALMEEDTIEPETLARRRGRYEEKPRKPTLGLEKTQATLDEKAELDDDEPEDDLET